MGSFNIKDFLTENKVTEVSQIEELRTRLKEVKGSETKEGKEIVDFFKKELGLGDAGKEYLEKSLDSSNPHSLRSAYRTVKDWKAKGYQPTPQDIAIMNDRLRR